MAHDEARKCLMKPFPDECEIKEMTGEKNDFLKTYRLRIHALIQKGCAYEIPDTQIILVSPPDNLCSWKALAHFAWVDYS